MAIARAGIAQVPPPTQLFPDLVTVEEALHDFEVVTSRIDGRQFIRFSNATANAGAGKLYLYGVTPPLTDGTQLVRQRLFRSDGSFTDRNAGVFAYHPEHNHVHVEEWTVYRVREMLPDRGVGAMIRGGEKASFCILDVAVHDATLPNFSATPEFTSCYSSIQGLSVGWMDLYERRLPGQELEVTGVPFGNYWLEAEVDPEDRFREADEENNAARIQVTLGDPDPAIPRDAYEPNDTIFDIVSRSEGQPTSPNLGPCDPVRVLQGTVDAPDDTDIFKIGAVGRGGEADFVRLQFDPADGELDLEVNVDGQTLPLAQSEDGVRTASLAGWQGTWWVVIVNGAAGGRSRGYTLTIDPPADGPPAVEVLAPPAGDTRLRLGLDAYSVRWSVSDREGDPTWVSVFLNGQPELDGREKLVPASLHTAGPAGFAVINSAALAPGTYWVYCRVTDGGTTTGSWSQGTITFAGDARTPFHRGDASGDGEATIGDAVLLFTFLFASGRAPRCREAADTGNDGSLDVADGIQLLNFLFLGGEAPAPPGPPSAPCAADPDPPGFPGDLGCDDYGGCG